MDDLIKKAKKVDITILYIGQLRPSGKCLVGCCPLHDDKSASFAIYPQTNSWYCFTEGVGGDVIAFMMRLKNIGFKEAIKELNYNR